MSQIDRLSSTLERLYAASLDAADWQAALLAVEEFTGCTGAVIDLVPREPNVRPRTFAGSFSSEDCAEYARDYQAICPRIQYVIAHPGPEVHYDRLVLTEAEMDRDPVYDWFGKHGLRYFLGGHAGHTRHFQAYASLQRTRLQGHADEDDIARFSIVRPHIAQALTIADMLGTLSAHQRFSDALLNALPQALFGLSDSGTVMFTNEAAEHLLARGTCVVLADGRLATVDPGQQRDLDLLIASAVGDPAKCGGGRLLIHRNDHRQPVPARVSRLMTRNADMFVSASVLVVVNEPAHQSLDEHALHELYGVTCSEARLAGALLNGHSLQSAAETMSVSVETLRCQLKSIFRKVGVSRQQDLVRILAELEMSSIVSSNGAQRTD